MTLEKQNCTSPTPPPRNLVPKGQTQTPPDRVTKCLSINCFSFIFSHSIDLKLNYTFTMYFKMTLDFFQCASKIKIDRQSQYIRVTQFTTKEIALFLCCHLTVNMEKGERKKFLNVEIKISFYAHCRIFLLNSPTS